MCSSYSWIVFFLHLRWSRGHDIQNGIARLESLLKQTDTRVQCITQIFIETKKKQCSMLFLPSLLREIIQFHPLFFKGYKVMFPKGHNNMRKTRGIYRCTFCKHVSYTSPQWNDRMFYSGLSFNYVWLGRASSHTNGSYWLQWGY